MADIDEMSKPKLYVGKLKVNNLESCDSVTGNLCGLQHTAKSSDNSYSVDVVHLGEGYHLDGSTHDRAQSRHTNELLVM